MRTWAWIAALSLGGATVVYAAGGGRGDLLRASSERTYPRASTDPRPQRLPPDAGRETLAVESVIGDSATFAYMQEMELVGSHLLLMDLMASQPVQVVDTATGAVRGAGRRGSGPGEIRWARSIQAVGPLHPTRAWIYDSQLGRATLFDIADPALRPVRIVRGPTSVYQGLWLGDTLIANGLFPRERLRVYGGRGEVVDLVRKEGVSPFAKELPDVVMLMNRTAMAAHPAGRGLVAAYRFRNQVDFYDRHGRVVKSVAGPDDFETEYSVVPDPREGINRFVITDRTVYGYVDVKAVGERVYALYSGRTEGEFKDDAASADRVHVFDWDGRLVDEIRLGAPVMRIALDPATRRIYGMRQTPHPSIVRFRPSAGAL